MAEDGSRGPKASVRFDPTRFKAARIAAGFTQMELSRQDNISVDSVRRAERGQPVSIETAQQLSRALNQPLSRLLRPEQTVYHLPGGRFEREKEKWVEYHGDKQFVVFDEFDANEEYIHLVCTRRRSEKGHRMLVRIPTKGGQIEWTWENPLEWQPFNIVKPKPANR